MTSVRQVVRDRVTGEVVDGHVIPNHALFTRTMGDESYRTLAFNDMLKVAIRLRDERLPQISDSPAAAPVGESSDPCLSPRLLPRPSVTRDLSGRSPGPGLRAAGKTKLLHLWAR